MIYIATTTINKPTKALKLFSKNKNCKLIVALDKKSKGPDHFYAYEPQEFKRYIKNNQKK